MIFRPGNHYYDLWTAEWHKEWFSFVLKYHHAPWKSSEMSANPNVSLEIVQAYPTLNWDFASLSENPNVTMEFVRSCEEWLDKWDWVGLSQLESITIEDVDKNESDRGQFSYPWLSACPNITAKMIVERPKPTGLPLQTAWNLQSTSAGYRDWNMSFLSYNPSTTYATVQEFPNLKWDFNELSRNPSITWQDVREHSDEAWSWDGLSENPNVDWGVVRQHLRKPWNISALSSRLPVTQATIDEFGDKIDFRSLSENPSVTEELISNNPHRAWDWDRLSATLPLSIIAANEPDLRTGMWNWNWKDVSRNPHLTFTFVEENKARPWNFTELSRNTQPYARAAFLAEREHAFFENSPKKLLHEELLDYFPGLARLGRSDTTTAAKEVLAILAKKRVNPDVAGSKRLREWRSFREGDGTRPRGGKSGEGEGGAEQIEDGVADMVVVDGDCAGG